MGGFISGYDFVKARIIGDYIATGAGRASSLVKFFDWVEDVLLHENVCQQNPNVSVNFPENLTENDFTGALLCADGTVIVYEGGGATLQMSQPLSLGSGADYATAAMDAGASPERAVEVAILRDVYSGGDVVTYEIDTHVEDTPTIDKESLKKYTKQQLIDMLTGA
jgi:ATP-dependent protease HslVU (ClpYQ) peptidase subunit